MLIPHLTFISGEESYHGCTDIKPLLLLLVLLLLLLLLLLLCNSNAIDGFFRGANTLVILVVSIFWDFLVLLQPRSQGPGNEDEFFFFWDPFRFQSE